MAVMQVLRYPNPVLRQKSRPVGEFDEEVKALAGSADLVLAAAAVGDYAPQEASQHKLKKENSAELILKLQRTPDVLAWLSSNRKKGAVVVGFAVETEREEEHARAKLERKGLDLVVLNNPTQPGAGFEVETNKVTVLGPKGFKRELALMSKDELADRLMELVIETQQ